MNNSNKNVVVFPDTNSLESGSLNTLFGHEPQFVELASVATIVLPNVILDEITRHKKHAFQQELSRLSKSPLRGDLDIRQESLDELNFEDRMAAIRESCKVSFEKASLTASKSAFQRIYSLAMSNKPPFDKGSDKGFKDACFVLTIDEYLKSHPQVTRSIVISEDSRVQDYFHGEGREIVSNVDECLHAILEPTEGNNSKFNKTTTGASPNAAFAKESSEKTCAVAFAEDLAHSRSFQETHDIVSRYANANFSNITASEALAILKACINNNQVSYLLSDNDVNKLILPIFEHNQNQLSYEEYSEFVDCASLPNDRLDPNGSASLSRLERKAYSKFVDGLVSHISSRDFQSTISTDAVEIESQLSKLISLAKIDRNVGTWQNIATVFIQNGVYASTEIANISTIEDFERLLNHSGNEKKKSILEALRFRLEETDVDIPF